MRPQLSTENLTGHARFLRQLARQLLAGEHDVDDAVQETMLKALQAREAPDHARPWLAKTLRFVARGRRRSDARRFRRETRAARPDRVEPESKELLATVTRAVLDLDEPWQSTILLRYYEGLSAAEIARREGIPSATVRSRLKRAQDLLREALDRTHGSRGAWSHALGLAMGHSLP
ncbi:MAG: sigma-70 family RNA polymerase sigma factor, partial [Planctomycetes bacterium]|nr:sigma-70 family RNA polymerase sigma factor [Planctomycetota bacterium]